MYGSWEGWAGWELDGAGTVLGGRLGSRRRWRQVLVGRQVAPHAQKAPLGVESSMIGIILMVGNFSFLNLLSVSLDWRLCQGIGGDQVSLWSGIVRQVWPNGPMVVPA